MKELAGTIDFIVIVAFILGLFWIFGGDPDLWDKWHAHAMEQGCSAQGENDG